MTCKKTLLIFITSFSFSQGDAQYIDGIAAIIEDHVVLKSDLIQMVNMAAIQNKIDPRTNPDAFVRLQNSVVQSMIDQKIINSGVLKPGEDIWKFVKGQGEECNS